LATTHGCMVHGNTWGGVGDNPRRQRSGAHPIGRRAGHPGRGTPARARMASGGIQPSGATLNARRPQLGDGEHHRRGQVVEVQELDRRVDLTGAHSGRGRQRADTQLPSSSARVVGGAQHRDGGAGIPGPLGQLFDAGLGLGEPKPGFGRTGASSVSGIGLSGQAP
jgi:hypothetical protein